MIDGGLGWNGARRGRARWADNDTKAHNETKRTVNGFASSLKRVVGMGRSEEGKEGYRERNVHDTGRCEGRNKHSPGLVDFVLLYTCEGTERLQGQKVPVDGNERQRRVERQGPHEEGQS